MSSGLTKIDWQQGTQMAWHKQTDIVADLDLSNNRFNQYEIIRKPLILEGGVSTPYSLFVASDDPQIQIGVPFTDSYNPMTNREWIDYLQETVLGVDGLKLVSIGTINGRNRRFATFELSEATHKHEGREFVRYLNFMDSVDKTQLFAFVMSQICTVCANTNRLNLTLAKEAEKNGGDGATSKHTKHNKRKLAAIQDKVNELLGAAAEFDRIFSQLADQPCKEDTAQRIFAGYLGEGEEMSTRTVNTVNRLTELYKVGAGNRGETLADVFSAVTDYYSHESSGGDDRMKQWVSSEFGAAADRKADFLPLVSNAGNRLQLIAKGKRSLELTSAN